MDNLPFAMIRSYVGLYDGYYRYTSVTFLSEYPIDPIETRNILSRTFRFIVLLFDVVLTYH